jgi:hypothetical protein
LHHDGAGSNGLHQEERGFYKISTKLVVALITHIDYNHI